MITKCDGHKTLSSIVYLLYRSISWVSRNWSFLIPGTGAESIKGGTKISIMGYENVLPLFNGIRKYFQIVKVFSEIVTLPVAHNMLNPVFAIQFFRVLLLKS